jgi:hypothetical protein
MTIQEYIDQINATHPKLNLRTERYSAEVTSPNPAWGRKYRTKMFRSVFLKEAGYSYAYGSTALGDLDLSEATKKTIDKWVKALLRQRADIAKANAEHDARVAAHAKLAKVRQVEWVNKIRTAMGYPEGTKVPDGTVAAGYNSRFVDAGTDLSLVITLPEDLDARAALIAAINDAIKLHVA